jgi:hypothetical protein
MKVKHKRHKQDADFEGDLYDFTSKTVKITGYHKFHLRLIDFLSLHKSVSMYTLQLKYYYTDHVVGINVKFMSGISKFFKLNLRKFKNVV